MMIQWFLQVNSCWLTELNHIFFHCQKVIQRKELWLVCVKHMLEHPGLHQPYCQGTVKLTSFDGKTDECKNKAIVEENLSAVKELTPNIQPELRGLDQSIFILEWPIQSPELSSLRICSKT
ncbi:hypothetical protein ILYODFUR_020714 [Ilyodon furcidens]|uniref:Uncharacterized protein n=1 Tax=Ilyodon furcidens TaxID=33524 RepID=A0ABV0UAX0_9TELE